MLEENKKLVRRQYEEVLNGKNLALVDEIMAANYVHHHPARDGLPTGLAGVKVFLGAMFSAFPDLRISIEDIIAEGDRVVVRGMAHATHTGPLMGIPPTGKTMSVKSIDIWRIAKGKIVEHWDVLDELGMYSQLGLVSLPQSGSPGR